MPFTTLGLLTVSSVLAQAAPAAQPLPDSQTALAQPQAPAAPPVPAPARECVPACRSGYVCHEGMCISACNPPCASGELCTGTGVCQLSAAPAAAAPAPAPAPAPRPAPESDAARDRYAASEELEPVREKPGPSGANLHVNALGVVQFGLIPRLEIGGSTTFLLGAHFYNTGLLSHVVIPGDDDEELEFSFGGNVGLRHYFNRGGGQYGGYLGAYLEYAALKMIDETNDMAEYHRNMVIPAVDAGYRWVWGSFLLDLGGMAGAAVPVSIEDKPIGAEGCRYVDSCMEESDTTPFAMATVDVGFFF